MKTIQWLLIALSFVVLLTGCQAVMKKMYGIKNPDIENESSILKKAKKYDLRTDNIVTVNVDDFPATLGGQGIPDCSIYDKNGRYIEYRQADTSCNAGLFGFIPALNLGTIYNQPDTVTLQEEFKKYRDLKGNAVVMPGDADFYVLIYWTVWSGKLNEDHVKVWEDLAAQNQKAKVKVVKVNLDLQEYWDKTKRDQMIQAFKKSKKS